jgi:hypothetical protein
MNIGMHTAIPTERSDLFAVAAAPSPETGTAFDIALDDEVYDEIESFIRDDLPRQGCIELAQALEDVMKLLMSTASDFSDIPPGRLPMGHGGGAA